MSRILPWDSTSSMRLPTMRWTCGVAPGPWVRAEVTSRPTRYGRRPAAVRMSVSPSGIPVGSARGAEGQAAVAGHEPRIEEELAGRGGRDVLAIDLAHDQLA